MFKVVDVVPLDEVSAGWEVSDSSFLSSVTAELWALDFPSVPSEAAFSLAGSEAGASFSGVVCESSVLAASVPSLAAGLDSSFSSVLASLPVDSSVSLEPSVAPSEEVASEFSSTESVPYPPEFDSTSSHFLSSLSFLL